MSLKLTYFQDNKGRNELTRLIFAVAGVQYEDDLIGLVQYRTLRDGGRLPWGQLPVLTICNGSETAANEKKAENSEPKELVFGQSCAISRYAAKIANLYPTNDLDALRTDAVVDSWRDTLDLYYDCYFNRKILGGRMQMIPRQPAERFVRFKLLLESELGEQFSRYEQMLVKNGGQVCVEDDAPVFPCWADLAIYDLVKTIEGPMSEDQFDLMMSDKAMLKSLVERIDSLETIEEHLKKYPYADLSNLFAFVPWWRRVVDSVLFPFIELVFSIKSRLTFMFRIDSKKSA